MNPSLRSHVSRIQQVALIVGIVCLALTVIGVFTNRRQFFISYLFGYLFWLGLALGCFSVTMLHHLTGGRWGYPTPRGLEAGVGALPRFMLLFFPIFGRVPGFLSVGAPPRLRPGVAPPRRR